METHRKCAGATVAVLALAVSWMIGTPDPAYAYVSVRAEGSGRAVQWGRGSRLTFRVNQINASGLSSDDVFTVFTTALNRWKQAAFDGFSFLYYQGSDPSRYPTHVGSPYDNSVFFTSNASGDDRLPCGTIGLTQLWFDSNGNASKADVRFNDLCYRFTTNASDTKSMSAIYLADVATHEFGHALGLDHSQNVESTMVPTAAIEMARPSCDDRAGMIELYGPENRAAKLSGRVISESGSAVFGAVVTAIHVDRGTAMNTTVTFTDGTFLIDGLEPGRYALMLEPNTLGGASLSRYYSAINTAVCGGSSFQRSFVLAGGGLRTFDIGAGARVDSGTIAVECAPLESINAGLEDSFQTAPEIASTDFTGAVGVPGVFASTGGSHRYFKLTAQTGTLVAHALTYSLGSNTDVAVEFLDGMGRRLSGQSTTDNVYISPDSGHVNYDASTSILLSAHQDVVVHVFSKSSLPSWTFPYGMGSGAAPPHFVVTVSRGNGPGALLSSNARCVPADTFGTYPRQGDAPPFSKNDDSSGCISFLSITEDGGRASGGSGSTLNRSANGRGSANRFLNFGLAALLLIFARAWMRRAPNGGWSMAQTPLVPPSDYARGI